jgi:type IV fimbrial biogenesis protein FimT
MSSRKHGRRMGGFTLAELMIVVLLVGAILAVGAPNFQQFRLNNRLTNAANDMLGIITVARTEAIKRQRSVSACRSDTPLSLDATCSKTSGAGWIVFLDADNNCVRGDTLSEPLVSTRTFDNTMANNALNVRTDGECLQFGASGFRQKVGGLDSLNHVTICDKRGMSAPDGQTMSAGRGVLITATGRARITRVVGGGSAEDVLSDAWKNAKCPS